MENEYYCLYQNEGIILHTIGADLEWLKTVASIVNEKVSVYKIKIEKLKEVKL